MRVLRAQGPHGAKGLRVLSCVCPRVGTEGGHPETPTGADPKPHQGLLPAAQDQEGQAGGTETFYTVSDPHQPNMQTSPRTHPVLSKQLCSTRQE